MADPALEPFLGPAAEEADLPWVLRRLARRLGLGCTPRAMRDALPHAIAADQAPAVLGALKRLGASPLPWPGSPASLPPGVLPALWEHPDGGLALVVGRTVDMLLVETRDDGIADRFRPATMRGRIYVFAGNDEARGLAGRALLPTLLAENRGAIAGLFALSVLATLASVALGLVVMVAFDLVIPAGDPHTLVLLGVGFAIALLADLGARSLMARGVAGIGDRAERRVLRAVFDKVVRLPWSKVAAQDPAGQVARMREIEAARELFTGPLPHAVLHLPLVLLFFGTIWAIAGPLVLVLLVVLPLQAGGVALLVQRARLREREAAVLSAERRRMMLETLSHASTLRSLGMDEGWLARFRDLSAGAVAAQARAARATHAVQALAQAALPVAAAGIAAVGAVLVIEQRITAGALVASIMLSWRVLVPMQTLVLAGTRSRQLAEAIRQLHRLQDLPEERTPPPDAPLPRPRGNALRLERVTFRPSLGADPAIAALSIAVPAGARVAITGPAGAGKSTLLRLVLGLAQPQTGSITIGGVNIAQFAPDQLRARIGYVPQRSSLIYGTVAQNLRLSAPGASDAELAEACARIGILQDLQQLPAGLDTRLDDLAKERMPQGLRQGIAIAQALLRRPAILLLDDPSRVLDAEREERLAALLDELHGSTTVLIVSHRPSQIMGADLLLVLDRGRLVSAGPPASVREAARLGGPAPAPDAPGASP